MPIRYAEVAMRSPTLCGRCPLCRSAGGLEDRVRCYVANLEEREVPSTSGAIDWLTGAYPPCKPVS